MLSVDHGREDEGTHSVTEDVAQTAGATQGAVGGLDVQEIVGL